MPWPPLGQSRFRRAASEDVRGPGDPYTCGLRLLAGRELTRAQLTARLAARFDDADAVAAAVNRLAEEGAVDDRRAAESYARTAHGLKGRGRDRIRRELAARGVDDRVARAVVNETVPAEADAVLIERALDRRWRGTIASDREARRAFSYLVRQGFPPEASRLAVERRRK
jgi:regulatory protein